MANSNLKQNIDEFKVANNAWFFNYQGTTVMVMKIPNYNYWAGVDGHIYSLKGKNIRRLREGNNGAGYLKVRPSEPNENPKMEYVHCLVANAWLENGEVDHLGNIRDEINHVDGSKSNNKLCNLERCSRYENMRHLRKILKSEDFKQARLN